MTLRTRKTRKRRSRRTRKRRCALYAGQHLHNHDATEARSRGRCSMSDRKVSDCTTDKSTSHTAISRRLERVRGRRRARHDSHRRGTGERRSHGCRSRARIAVRRSAQCHRAFASNLENIGEDVRRQKCVVLQKSAAHELPNLRVSPLAPS